MDLLPTQPPRLEAPPSSTPRMGLTRPREIPQKVGVIPSTVNSLKSGSHTFYSLIKLQPIEYQDKKTDQSLRNLGIEQNFFH